MHNMTTDYKYRRGSEDRRRILLGTNDYSESSTNKYCIKPKEFISVVIEESKEITFNKSQSNYEKLIHQKFRSLNQSFCNSRRLDTQGIIAQPSPALHEIIIDRVLPQYYPSQGTKCSSRKPRGRTPQTAKRTSCVTDFYSTLKKQRTPSDVPAYLKHLRTDIRYLLIPQKKSNFTDARRSFAANPSELVPRSPSIKIKKGELQHRKTSSKFSAFWKSPKADFGVIFGHNDEPRELQKKERAHNILSRQAAKEEQLLRRKYLINHPVVQLLERNLKKIDANELFINDRGFNHIKGFDGLIPATDKRSTLLDELSALSSKQHMKMRQRFSHK